MSMQLKVFPSMLFCHSTPSSDGQDEILEVIIVFDPKIGPELVEMFAIGRSEKNILQVFANIDKNKLVMRRLLEVSSES